MRTDKKQKEERLRPGLPKDRTAANQEERSLEGLLGVRRRPSPRIIPGGAGVFDPKVLAGLLRDREEGPCSE